MDLSIPYLVFRVLAGGLLPLFIPDLEDVSVSASLVTLNGINVADEYSQYYFALNNCFTAVKWEPQSNCVNPMA